MPLTSALQPPQSKYMGQFREENALYPIHTYLSNLQCPQDSSTGSQAKGHLTSNGIDNVIFITLSSSGTIFMCQSV